MERINNDSTVWSHYGNINKNLNKRFNFYCPKNASKSLNNSVMSGVLSVESKNDSKRIKNDKRIKLGKEQFEMIKNIKLDLKLGETKKPTEIPYSLRESPNRFSNGG